ncbi:MAG TPA: Wzz/FepE/Etk N-terminal domain-containing protein [Planctomycetota bacterium]|nr:Wzz/FepE/Etk N-terminal domain-containing protein [Planctomycetota bacterium]
MTGPTRQDELTLVDYAAMVWRRRKLVLACALAGLAVAAAAHFVLPKKYEATALILPPQEEGSNTGVAAKLAGLSENIPPGLLGIKAPAERYVDMLRSQKVADAIIDRFGLAEKYGAGSRVKTRDVLAGSSAFVVTKGSLLSITVTDADPKAAADMANAYVEVLEKIDRDIGVGKAGRERQFLEGRVAEVEKDLKSAQEAWRAFQEKHRIVAVDEGLKATATVMAELEARRIAKEIEVQVLETAYSKASPQVELARAELQKLGDKLKEVSRYGVRAGPNPQPPPLNPQPSGSPPPAPDADASGWLFPAVEKVPELALEQLDLERRLRLQVELYKLLVTQREMARINEAKERSTLQVVAAATAPDRRAGMGVAQKALFGVAIGLGLGVMLACVQKGVLGGLKASLAR